MRQTTTREFTFVHYRLAYTNDILSDLIRESFENMSLFEIITNKVPFNSLRANGGQEAKNPAGFRNHRVDLPFPVLHTPILYSRHFLRNKINNLIPYYIILQYKTGYRNKSTT